MKIELILNYVFSNYPATTHSIFLICTLQNRLSDHHQTWKIFSVYLAFYFAYLFGFCFCKELSDPGLSSDIWKPAFYLSWLVVGCWKVPEGYKDNDALRRTNPSDETGNKAVERCCPARNKDRLCNYRHLGWSLLTPAWKLSHPISS